MRASNPEMYISVLESKVSMLDAETKHLKNLMEVTKTSFQKKIAKEEASVQTALAQVEKLEVELRNAYIRSEQSDYDCDLLTNTNEQLRKRVSEQKAVIQQLTIALTKLISAQKDGEDFSKYIASAELLLNNLQQGISPSLALISSATDETPSTETKNLGRFLLSFVNRFTRGAEKPTTLALNSTSPACGPIPAHVNDSLQAIVDEFGSIALAPFVPAEALIQLPSPSIPTSSSDNSFNIEQLTETPPATLTTDAPPSSGYLTVLTALNALNPITDAIYAETVAYEDALREAEAAEDADEELSESSEDTPVTVVVQKATKRGVPITQANAMSIGLPLAIPAMHVRTSGDHDRAQLERTARLIKEKHAMQPLVVSGVQADGIAIVQKLDPETEKKAFAARAEADLQRKLHNERLFVSTYSKKVLDEFLKDEERRKQDFDVHVANLRDFVSKDPSLAAEEQPFLDRVNVLYENKRNLELEQRLNERMRSGLAKILTNPSIDNKTKEQALFLINRRTTLVASDDVPDASDIVKAGNLAVKVVQAPAEEYLASLPISRSELVSNMRVVEAEREKRLREEARQEILRAQRQKSLHVPVEKKGNDLYDYNGGFSPMRLMGAIGRTIDKAMEKYSS